MFQNKMKKKKKAAKCSTLQVKRDLSKNVTIECDTYKNYKAEKAQ